MPLFPSDLKAGFQLNGAKGKALLLHGFTGTPNEVRPLAEIFSEFGFCTAAPLLPGHGRHSAAINETTCTHWALTAKDSLLNLKGEGPTVVAGISMGGLLATILAAERPVDALVLVAPAFDLFAGGKMGVTLSRMGVHKIFPTLPKAEKGGDLVDKAAQQQNPNNDDIPMRALQELKKLQQLATLALDQIQVPVLLVHGEKDRTVPPQASIEVSRRLKNAPEVILHRFSASGHVLPLDLEQANFKQALRLFIKDVVTRT